MITDATDASHPLVNDKLKGNSGVEQMFDAISYDKGGCLISMINDFLTPDVFSSGVNQYLKDNQYGSASTGDLW
jgi:aminopeptidase 2